MRKHDERHTEVGSRVHVTTADSLRCEAVTGGTVCGKTARTGLWGSRWATTGSTRIASVHVRRAGRRINRDDKRPGLRCSGQSLGTTAPSLPHNPPPFGPPPWRPLLPRFRVRWQRVILLATLAIPESALRKKRAKFCETPQDLCPRQVLAESRRATRVETPSKFAMFQQVVHARAFFLQQQPTQT